MIIPLQINPYITELINLHCQSLEIVSRNRDTQLQVNENVCYLWNLSPNIYQSFKIEGIFYCEQSYNIVLTKTQCLLQSMSVL